MNDQMKLDDGSIRSAIGQAVACPPNSENTQNPLREWDFALKVQVVDFLSGYAVEGVLEGFTPGEVTVSLAECVSEQRAVKVCMESFSFEGETLYCQPRETRFEAHISIGDAGKTGLRRTPRFPVRLSGRLLPPNASPVEITLVDISRDGVGIELPVLLEVGQPIALVIGSIFVFAVVRHCHRTPEGLFRAGCEMHHLFEGPVQSSADPVHSGILQAILGRWPFTKTPRPLQPQGSSAH